jgi:hypothetical protein
MAVRCDTIPVTEKNPRDRLSGAWISTCMEAMGAKFGPRERDRFPPEYYNVTVRIPAKSDNDEDYRKTLFRSKVAGEALDAHWKIHGIMMSNRDDLWEAIPKIEDIDNNS